MDKENKEFDEKSFKPKGAMAFFVLMIISYIFLWFTVYFVMISRM